MGRAKLSVVMFGKNEARRIAAALETVRWADEIVIVDDASSDETAEICRSFGARVITCEDSRGAFYKRRNFGFSQTSSEWILMMDPDERVTPELREAIVRALEDPQDYAGFIFGRRNFFWNRPLLHGGWQETILHLFRKGAGGDRGLRVHSPIEVEGRVGRLAAAIDHFPFESLSQIIEKQNFYTSFEAKELIAEGRWSRRQCARRALLRPMKIFWKRYVKKLGFLDGLPGFVLALIFSWVECLRWAKCWELAGRSTEQPAASRPSQSIALSSHVG